MSDPILIIADLGSGYLVIDGRQSKIHGKTPYTNLKFGVCKGRIDTSFAGFRAQEVNGSVILSRDGRSVPVTTDIQTMAEGFLKQDETRLSLVWDRNMERVRGLFA
ncbi:MAG: hypothetical protein JRN45_00580 [Nitrososphaerota archaeon]|nr:hypothetical protein [Nitrososphaerota archaeon]